jgi:hypothetical protein
MAQGADSFFSCVADARPPRSLLLRSHRHRWLVIRRNPNQITPKSILVPLSDITADDSCMTPNDFGKILAGCQVSDELTGERLIGSHKLTRGHYANTHSPQRVTAVHRRNTRSQQDHSGRLKKPHKYL